MAIAMIISSANERKRLVKSTSNLRLLRRVLKHMLEFCYLKLHWLVLFLSDRHTVDLIHLASHFQRVEQQRYSMQVKQENGRQQQTNFAMDSQVEHPRLLLPNNHTPLNLVISWTISHVFFSILIINYNDSLLFHLLISPVLWVSLFSSTCQNVLLFSHLIAFSQTHQVLSTSFSYCIDLSFSYIIM